MATLGLDRSRRAFLRATIGSSLLMPAAVHELLADDDPLAPKGRRTSPRGRSGSFFCS